MRHPLENPSLAPIGYAFPLSVQRLGYKPKNQPLWISPEQLILKHWARANRSTALRPLPIQQIIHEILPARSANDQLRHGDFMFEGLLYLGRDIMLLSSVVQWFGTSCGRVFLEDNSLLGTFHTHPSQEFLLKLEHDRHPVGLVLFLTHTCNDQCKVVRTLFGAWNHHYRKKDATPRDHAVVKGLMHWLGQPDGRAFVAHYVAHKQRLLNAVSARNMRRFKLRLKATP